MELRTVYRAQQAVQELVELPFIEANTIPMALDIMRDQHIIPVFTKDNHALISQTEFIQSSYDVLSSIYTGNIDGPYIRVSHPVKGRIPSARHKKANELLPEEETLYYERMMFVYIVPSVSKTIHGQELKLVIGGVKAYNKDNVNRGGNTPQHFSFFIGFQVKVCSNLCIWTDGVRTDICVNSAEELKKQIIEVFTTYNPETQIKSLHDMQELRLTLNQFAHLLGRCKLYHHMSKSDKLQHIPCGLNDTQLNIITRDYFHDDNFSGSHEGISLWSLYNLCTHALKTSYIDTYVENNVMLDRFFRHLAASLHQGSPSWYLI